MIAQMSYISVQQLQRTVEPALAKGGTQAGIVALFERATMVLHISSSLCMKIAECGTVIRVVNLGSTLAQPAAVAWRAWLEDDVCRDEDTLARLHAADHAFVARLLASRALADPSAGKCALCTIKSRWPDACGRSAGCACEWRCYGTATQQHSGCDDRRRWPTNDGVT